MSWFRRSEPPAPDQNHRDADAMAAYAARARAYGGRDFQGTQMPSLFRVLVTTAARYLEQRSLPAEQRTITSGSVPWNVGGDAWGTGTGQTPSPEQALRLGAVYSAISLIADLIAMMPLKAYRDLGEQKVQMPALPQLFQQPSVIGTLDQWVHRCLTSLLSSGNAWGLKTGYDGYGYPTGIEWLNPLEVTVEDSRWSGPGSFTNPVIRWRGVPIDLRELVHIPWLTMPFRVAGISPIGAYALTVKSGLSAQKYAADWFDAGGVPPGTFKNVRQQVSDADAASIKSTLVSAIRTHQPIVYGADWDYNPIAIPPQEAKFVETMRLTATQIAAIYRIVQPELIGGESGKSLTYSNVEANMTNLVMITLMPFCVKLERAFFPLLPEKQYVKFNADSLIRADIQTRHLVYQIDRHIGLKSINELRPLEEMPPIDPELGDDYAPLTRAGTVPPADQALTPNPGAPAPSGGPNHRQDNQPAENQPASQNGKSNKPIPSTRRQ